jgi:hypothetical protein
VINAGAVEFPGVLEAPMALDQMSAQLQWRIEHAGPAGAALPQVVLQVKPRSSPTPTCKAS